jgi:hypothetical protein
MFCVASQVQKSFFLKAINRLIIKYLNQKDMLVVLEVVALLAVIVLPLFPAKKTANK